MRKRVELPIVEPVYRTYHYQGASTAVIASNPSIRNWYLNYIMNLTCSRRFLSGFTTPEITIPNSAWEVNMCLDKKRMPMEFARGYINPIIREMLNNGYYVNFEGIDDYYIRGKSWYRERHFEHDGLICGYDQDDKTYCIYAYDTNWVYQTFWTPQKAFDAGRVATEKQGRYGTLCAMKPKSVNIVFLPEIAYEKLQEYLDSSLEKYPKDGEGNVYGTIVHMYIAEYIAKLSDGSIPYERMDRRVFCLIWEHKKVMLERIEAMERALDMDTACSQKYRHVVAEADTMRMLYASHHMKRRDSVLPLIRKKLLALMEEERAILTELTDEVGKKLK